MSTQELRRLKEPIVYENGSILRGDFDINSNSNFIVMDEEKKRER